MQRTILFGLLIFLTIPCGQAVIAVGDDVPQQSKTGPTPPDAVLQRDAERGFVPTLLGATVIAGVPEYNWRHGCGPTAVGMVVGYYDGQGYDDLMPGDVSAQNNDANQAMASGGVSGNPADPCQHYEDYSCPEDSYPNPLTDAYITQGQPAHPDNCIGDYMRTSQSTHPSGHNYYGWSWSIDVGPSFTCYVNQQNASYGPSYTEYRWSTGAMTWAVLTNEIDNNRPMVFLVDTDGDGNTDHFVTVIGYDDNTNEYGCYDTWSVSPGIRWETFQGVGEDWGIWGGWSFRLLSGGENTDPLLYNARVEPPSGTTLINYEYLVDYHDVDGDPPDYIKVYIDSSPHYLGLTPISGTPASGTYHLPGISLSAGTHHYWFEARDVRFGYAETDFAEGPVVGTGTGNDLSMYSLQWDDDDPSDGDGIPEAGEGVDLGVCLKNISDEELTGVIVTLTTNIGNVDITDDTVVYGTLSSGEKSWAGDEFDMFLDFASTWYDLPFELYITYMKNSIEYQQSIPFTKTFYEDGQLEPIFEVDHTVVDDSKWGDNDGIPESGEGLEFDLYIKNTGSAPAIDVEVSISDPSVGSTDEGRWYDYPDLDPGSVTKQTGSSDYNLRDIPRSFSGWITADVTVRCAGNPDKLIANHPLFEVMPTAWLHVSPEVWDFGVSPTTDDVTKIVTVHNQGTEDLIVTGITPSHPDTSGNGDPLPWTITPGNSKTMEVIIETSGLQGLISREVVVNVGTEVHIDNDRVTITGLVSDAVPFYQVPGATSADRIDVSGNLIVYNDHRNGNSDIYAYNLATGVEIAVCTDSNGQGNPRISGDLVVWEDWRNDDGSWSNADIIGYDLSTGQEIVVSSNPAYERLIGAAGNMVAFGRVYYEFTETSNWDEAWNLHVYEYQGEGQFNEIYTTDFSPTPGHDPKPSIYPNGDFGDSLLFFERHDITWYSQYGYWGSEDQHLEKIDFALGETGPSRISIGWRSPFSATTHRFVYKDDDGDYEQIWLWDNGSISQVTYEAVDHADNPALAISGNLIVYDKLDFDGLFYWDLNTSQESLLTDEVGYSEYARMDENCVVWISYNPGQIMYYAFLNEADIAVSSPDIVFSNEQPIEGSTIDVNVTVHNLNPWDTTEDITVQLYDGDPNDPNAQLGSDEVISGGIIAQGSEIVTFNDIPVGIEGPHNIYACINVLGGDNPANNKAYKTLMVADTDIQGPIISNVVVQELNGNGDGRIEDDEQIMISWQATDISGINSSWCTIDANDYAASGTYYVIVGPYAVGNYDFTISATDGDISPETTQYSNSFLVSFRGDINEDGKVNFEDIKAMADQWLQLPGTPSADVAPWPGGDGIVNFRDFAVLAENWLAGAF